jgi:hypothetical protein
MSSNNLYAEILNFVIDNGRVQQIDSGFDEQSLIEEIKFESRERSLSDQQIQECIDFAISHSQVV